MSEQNTNCTQPVSQVPYSLFMDKLDCYMKSVLTLQEQNAIIIQAIVDRAVWNNDTPGAVEQLNMIKINSDIQNELNECTAMIRESNQNLNHEVKKLRKMVKRSKSSVGFIENQVKPRATKNCKSNATTPRSHTTVTVPTIVPPISLCCTPNTVVVSESSDTSARVSTNSEVSDEFALPSPPSLGRSTPQQNSIVISITTPASSDAHTSSFVVDSKPDTPPLPPRQSGPLVDHTLTIKHPIQEQPHPQINSPSPRKKDSGNAQPSNISKSNINTLMLAVEELRAENRVLEARLRKTVGFRLKRIFGFKY